MKKVENMRTVMLIMPGGENARSSEGDFLRLKDGRIMFAYSRFRNGSHDDSPSDIAAVYSSDNGESFSDPKIIVPASFHGVENVMSVTLMRMENGDVGLFYIVKYPADATDEYVLRRSRDEGESFGPPVTCIPGHFKGYYVINNSRVLKTSDKRLIIPAAQHRSTPRNKGLHVDGRSNVGFFTSEDDGFTWSENNNIIVMPDMAYSNSGLQEPGLIELSNGVLYAYMRTDRYAQYESFSYDRGYSWTPARPSRFTAPCSPLKIAQNPYSGEFFAVWNPIPNFFGRDIAPASAGRTPLVMARSENGLDFSEPLLVEDDPTRGFCYPSLFFADEKTLLLSYCFGGKEEGGFLNCLKIRRIAI